MKNYTILDNYNIDENNYLDSYKENAIQTSLSEYANECINMEYEDLLNNLEHSKENDSECVVIGSLGLWNGRKNIEPLRCDTLTSAIEKCIGNSDYTIIKKVGGYIEVTSIHHDGRNVFCIHKLNDKGLSAGENADLSNSCYHKVYPKYIY